MFSGYEKFYKGSKTGSPDVYFVRLDRDELIDAFGKVRIGMRLDISKFQSAVSAMLLKYCNVH